MFLPWRNGLRRSGKKLLPVLPAALWLLSPVMAEELPVYLERLPETPMFCSLVGDKNPLLKSLAGRPAAIYVTNIPEGANNPLGNMLAEIQQDYFYWFTWAGLLVGPASPEERAQMQSRAPFHLERCFGDKDGTAWKTLGLKVLPSLVLVNEDGYIVMRSEGAGMENKVDVMKTIDLLARSGKLEGKTVRDFKLPEIESGRLLTLLDVTVKDYTMLFYLNSNSSICRNELKMLDHLRNRYSDQVALVTVFQEQKGGDDIGDYLRDCQVDPDFVLRDPQYHQASDYSFKHVPVLLIVGPEGKIVFARKGFEVERSWDLSTNLTRFFESQEEAPTARPFKEVRRIHSETLQYIDEGKIEMALHFLDRILELSPGLTTIHSLMGDLNWRLGLRKKAVEHYSRYISSHPEAYDLEEIKEKLRAIVSKSN